MTPLALLLFAAAASAQDAPKTEPKKDIPKDALKESLTETSHTIMVNGGKLDYVATAGTLLLRDDAGKPTASVFFVAYVKSGVKDRAKRPITFTFNGGPGSSSVWLHLGAFGPRRVQLNEEPEPTPPPYRLVDNEQTILDLTDLVFIDPVSTGFSRPAPGTEAKLFHGVQEDVQSVGDFIRLYATRFDRWDSPKFLAGESYGTTRAAGLAGYLQDRHGLNLNGIVLVSAVLNFQTLRFDDGNDLPYVLYLPAYTATAWYHKKLPTELQNAGLRKAVAQAEQYAQGPYTLALMKGDKLTEAERQAVAVRLAYLTGLSEDYLLRTNLRIHIGRFTRELLRNERRTVGRYDSRYKGIDVDAAAERPEYDPSYAAVQGAFTATLNHYLKKELNYQNEQTYEILTGRVQPWSYSTAKNRYLNVSDTLRQAMTKNPDMRVFVANGYYDLATPPFATQYTFDHLGLDRSLTDHVTMGFYEAGHMMYVSQAAHRQLKRDLASFFQSALRP
jgi:carboxypeptidase C (cathepsin A)